MKHKAIRFFLGINLLCLGVVLYANHRVISLMLIEHRVVSDGVDGIAFFIFAAPALVLALLTNVIWGVMAISIAIRHRTFETAGWLAICVAIWSASLFGIPWANTRALSVAQPSAPADGPVSLRSTGRG